MGFFNFVETFFFISLAITFVLIMMLVYHFKERLSALEKKSNTIVDIINNVVKEITLIKHSHSPSPYPMVSAQYNSNPLCIQSQNVDDDSSESSEYESDEDSTLYDDLGGEREEEEAEVKSIVELDVIEDRETRVNEEEEPENIKRININLSLPVNEDLDDLEDIQEIEPEDLYLEDKIENVEMSENETTVVVNKIDGFNESNLEEAKVVPPVDIEFYRKMEIGALRTLVISKGLATDTKKMKKSDLLRLLESAHE
jgi:hypothetical protein